MDEQSVEILKECSSGCKMAIGSMNQVMEYVRDEKLGKIIEDANQAHCKLEERATKALANRGKSAKDPGKAAEMYSWLTTEMKMMIKDDSRQIAKLMTNGCNMGIQSIMEVINKNTQADRESMDIAQSLVKIEEDFMEQLREFL